MRGKNGLTIWILKTEPKKNLGKLGIENKTRCYLARSRGNKYTADELKELILNNQRRKIEEGPSYGQITNLFECANSITLLDKYDAKIGC